MRARKLGLDEVTLPRGTRVLLRAGIVDDEGASHPAGTLCVVREGAYHTYFVETPGGARLKVQRDQLRLQRDDMLEALGRLQWQYRTLRDEVILATTVGSRAWGLADEQSDEDVRGCFVLPFDAHASLWDAPDEIHDDVSGSEAYWEIEKLVRQGLRADANTLEMLWSPLVKVITPLGQELVERRAMFISMNILGSFGRYATSQLDKVRRSLARKDALNLLLDAILDGRAATAKEARALLPPSEDLASLVRSLFDRGLIEASSFDVLVRTVSSLGADRLRPEEVRPKNAYNLVRLLHSCISWLEHGRPLISVEGELRATLLAIKRGETPIEQTLQLAGEAAARIEEVAPRSALPPSPDHAAAEELLQDCRRRQARRFFAMAPSGRRVAGGRFELDDDAFVPAFLPAPLPIDVDVSSTKRFLSRFLDGDLAMRPRTPLWIALSGAHAYGFPSPDSDLDIKGIDSCPAERLLGVRGDVAPLERIEVFEGREMDFSSHEVGLAVRLILKGNGNMLERLLGPLPLLTTRAGERLAELARASLSRRCAHHYGGFFRAMRREYEVEEAAGRRRAKRLLYAYRVALTGAHLLLSGELVTDVRPLAEQHGFAAVTALLAHKARAEKEEPPVEEAARAKRDFDALESLLAEAEQRSALPPEPVNADDLDAFLVETRMALSPRLTA